MRKTLSLLIYGKVQGVFYRQSTREKAVMAGITGFVKNQPDGSVQIIATGTTEQLTELTNWCKEGPAKAIVSSVIVQEITFQEFTHFTIQR